MDAHIAAAAIAACAAIVLPAITYFFTKRKERGDELRKERLEHYKEFVRSLSGVRMGEDTPEGHQAYMLASNSLNLIAPQRVIAALQAFREETSMKNNDRDYAREGRLLTALFLEIRKDLGVYPKDDINSSVFALWLSGQGRPQEK